MYDWRYDLNKDTDVNSLDRTFWVEELKRTYFGDANLDGEFTSTDFVQVFQRGEYEDSLPANSTWASGDWNGDGEFSSTDFVVAFQAGGYEVGHREGTRAVPEPAGWLLASVGFILLTVGRRQRA